jgi:hypothetical protein
VAHQAQVDPVDPQDPVDHQAQVDPVDHQDQVVRQAQVDHQDPVVSMLLISYSILPVVKEGISPVNLVKFGLFNLNLSINFLKCVVKSVYINFMWMLKSVCYEFDSWNKFSYFQAPVDHQAQVDHQDQVDPQDLQAQVDHQVQVDPLDQVVGIYIFL